MRCNNCGADMKAALYRTEGWSEKLVILDNYNAETGRHEMTGRVMYCPECGSLQVELKKENQDSQ